MDDTSPSANGRGASAAAGVMARRLAGGALVVLVLAAVLFGGAWVIGGDDAVSDNWVGVTVVLALFLGLCSAFIALVIAVFAGLVHEPWGRLWLPLATFPTVVAIVVLLEVFVFE